MDSSNFLSQLKQALAVLDERLTSLEHSVNDVLIGSLRESAEEYEDEQNFNTFHDNYGSELADLVEPYKVLCGEDFDVERGLYDNLKEVEGYGTDGFDEKSLVEAKIAEIKDKLAQLENIKKDVENKEDDGKVEDEEEIPSDEELAKEFANAVNK